MPSGMFALCESYCSTLVTPCEMLRDRRFTSGKCLKRAISICLSCFSAPCVSVVWPLSWVKDLDGPMRRVASASWDVSGTSALNRWR